MKKKKQAKKTPKFNNVTIYKAVPDSPPEGHFTSGYGIFHKDK